MRYKNILFLSILFVFTMILTACGQAKPQSTIDEFMASIKNYDFEEASQHYSEEFEDVENKADDVISNEDLDGVEGYEELVSEFKRLMSNLEYTVVDEEISEDGSSAKLKVDLSYADANEPIIEAIESLFGEVFSSAFDGKELTDEEIQELTVQLMKEKLSEYEAEIVSKVGQAELKKNGEGVWKISSLDDNYLNALVFGLREISEGDVEEDEE